MKNVKIYFNRNEVPKHSFPFEKTWTIKKFIDNVYHILWDTIDSNWLIKYYDNKENAQTEIKHLYKLQDLSVPRILVSGISDGFNYVIISKAVGVDLYKHIYDNGEMVEKEIRNVVKQLLNIVSEMHSRNIIHMDIKPENIIYDSSTGKITLIDFEGRYTDDYSSPNVVLGYDHKDHSDIWALGVTTYYMFYGECPFSDDKEILSEPVPFDEKCSKGLTDFIRTALNRRIPCTAKKLQKHYWLQ